MKGRIMRGLKIISLIVITVVINFSCQKSRFRSNLKTEVIFSIKRGDMPLFKSKAELPDTNEFLLTIKKYEGEIIYYGKYGVRPETIKLESGIYEFRIESIIFEEAAFDSPDYGDIKIIEIGKESTVGVVFLCKQLNSGIRLRFTDNYRKMFEGGSNILTGVNGELLYDFSESRIAYFVPGKLSLKWVNSSGSEEVNLFSRTLNRSEILTANLDYYEDSVDDSGIMITLDTMRIWLDETIILGAERDGSSIEKAIKVEDIYKYPDVKGVWIEGYIVGGDMTQTSVNFTSPFESKTHIVLSFREIESLRSNCVPVELKQGTIRDNLNLADNPDIQGKKLWIKGDVEKYFGLTGVKSVKDYSLILSSP